MPILGLRDGIAPDPLRPILAKDTTP